MPREFILTSLVSAAMIEACLCSLEQSASLLHLYARRLSGKKLLVSLTNGAPVDGSAVDISH